MELQPLPESAAPLRAVPAPDRVDGFVAEPSVEIYGALIAVGEAARSLGISSSTIRRWIDSGRIAAVRTSGGHRRVPAAEVRRMSGLLAGTLTPLVREVPLPAQELPELAELLKARGRALVDLAIRVLYEPNRPGWFAVPTNRERLHQWAGALGQSVLSADWSSALATTQDLIVESHRAGSSLVERVQYLERFGDVSVRALEQDGAAAWVALDTRRLFRNLRQVALADS
jgi:excisionase family DNA binding protein